MTGGGEPSRRGWVEDRCGLAWQVVPDGVDELFSDADPARAQRAVRAVPGTGRRDLRAARRGGRVAG